MRFLLRMAAFTGSRLPRLWYLFKTGSGWVGNPVNWGSKFPHPWGADFVDALVAAVDSMADVRRLVAGRGSVSCFVCRVVDAPAEAGSPSARADSPRSAGGIDCLAGQGSF